MPDGGEDTFWVWAGCCPDPVDCPVHILHLGCEVGNLSRAVVYEHLSDFPVSETPLLQHRPWLVVGEHGLPLTLPLITKCSFTSMGDCSKHCSQPRRRSVCAGRVRAAAAPAAVLQHGCFRGSHLSVGSESRDGDVV